MEAAGDEAGATDRVGSRCACRNSAAGHADAAEERSPRDDGDAAGCALGSAPCPEATTGGGGVASCGAGRKTPAPRARPAAVARDGTVHVGCSPGRRAPGKWDPEPPHDLGPLASSLPSGIATGRALDHVWTAVARASSAFWRDLSRHLEAAS